MALPLDYLTWKTYYPSERTGCPDGSRQVLEPNLHSPERRLIELKMEHADLDAMVDRLGEQTPLDELLLRRLKKRRLGLRDEIARLELALEPKEPA